ncbi:DNA alkylation repair protein [Candidatus Saccharibacteria bacterium]|nr:DNA alkylation repair protein [Candidatus Saccharibacteria bacterium]
MTGNYNTFRQQLASAAEDDYRQFIMKGIPSDRPFIGVRIPKLRQIVSQIPAPKYSDFLRITPMAFEEVVARGMIICRLPYKEALAQFDSQIHYIDDWCACDTFCSELRKIIKRHQSEFFEAKLDNLLSSQQEFATRAGLVILKCSYLEPDYLNIIFDRIESLASREEYYIRMAIAWLVAECFIKFPEETLYYLKVSHLPKWTFNKAISKICDSYRVEKDTKEILKTLRK